MIRDDNFILPGSGSSTDKSKLPGRVSESDSSEKRPAVESKKVPKKPKTKSEPKRGSKKRKQDEDADAEESPEDEHEPIDDDEHDDDDEGEGLAGLADALKFARQKAMKRPASKGSKESAAPKKKPGTKKRADTNDHEEKENPSFNFFCSFDIFWWSILIAFLMQENETPDFMRLGLKVLWIGPHSNSIWLPTSYIVESISHWNVSHDSHIFILPN